MRLEEEATRIEDVVGKASVPEKGFDLRQRPNNDRNQGNPDNAANAQPERQSFDQFIIPMVNNAKLRRIKLIFQAYHLGEVHFLTEG